jgi:hypothetical protein
VLIPCFSAPSQITSIGSRKYKNKHYYKAESNKYGIKSHILINATTGELVKNKTY